MYCILITGIPAAGKSTMAEYLSERLGLPVLSKDRIKELLFDCVGFRSREEKVRLGVAGMNITYYAAEQLMRRELPFILENNFENISKEPLMRLLREYSYTAITVALTGDYGAIYRRFAERNADPDRHRGHVVNDRYPEADPGRAVEPISYEAFVEDIRARGMDSFTANGPRLVIDTTDLQTLDKEAVSTAISAWMEEILRG